MPFLPGCSIGNAYSRGEKPLRRSSGYLTGKPPYKPDRRRRLGPTYFISLSADSRPTRAHQPMFEGSLSVVFAGVSPAE
jgi:hypothetical protein